MVDSATRSRSRVVLAVIAVVVVGAIATAAVLSALRPTTEYDPGTPEGVAQRFYEAVLDDDDAAAFALMTDELRDRCEALRHGFPFLAGSARVVLESSEVEGDRAVVTVEIAEISDPSPFDVDGFSHRQRLMMVGGPAAWQIDEPPWPYFCPEGS